MPIARVNGKILHFVHAPKTGGSSVTSYLRSVGHVALHSRQPVNWARVTPQHMDIESAEALLPDGFVDARFTILRDPLARMVSEFRYRYTRLLDAGHSAKPYQSGDPVTVELDWGQTFCGTFETWVDKVFQLYQHDNSTCDNHIRPQADFVSPDAKVFLFEDGLDKVFDWIDRFAGINRAHVELDRNASKRLPFEVSEAVQQRIRQFYERDYALIADLREKQGQPVA